MTTPQRTRLNPKDRRLLLTEAMLDEAEQRGFQNITRQAIADRAGCSPNLVSNYFKTMPQLRRSLMRAAVTRERLAIIAQGIVARDENALAASEELRARALQHASKA
jgi:AcrR family transcriptional regulator